MNDSALQSEVVENVIKVRAIEPADMDAVAEILSLPGVRYGTLSIGYRSAAALRSWFGGQNKRNIRVCALIDGRVVGQAGLEVQDRAHSHCAHIGIGIHDAFQGRGVGTALMRALIDSADGALGLRRIELTVFADNAPAIALYRKFGFVEEGRSRGYAMRDGVLADVLHLARLADAPRFE